jgi:hypothetical protein
MFELRIVAVMQSDEPCVPHHGFRLQFSLEPVGTFDGFGAGSRASDGAEAEPSPEAEHAFEQQKTAPLGRFVGAGDGNRTRVASLED